MMLIFSIFRVASNIMLVKINVAEQLLKHNRGSCLVFLDLFWVASHMLGSGNIPIAKFKYK